MTGFLYALADLVLAAILAARHGSPWCRGGCWGSVFFGSRGVTMGEHTPVRTIRVDPALWEAAQAVAALRGETVSSVIRAALVRYVKRHTN